MTPLPEEAPAPSTPGARFLVGLVGEGITASLTPPMHEAEATALGLDYEYRVLDLLELRRPPSALAAILEEARRLGFAALNVTHPCKQLVLDVIDELDPDAERVGAVNLVVFEGERLIGYNTDWLGYREGLVAGLPGVSFDRVVQVGCGGAGAATAYALLSCGADRLDLFDVDEVQAEELAERMRPHFPTRVIATVTRETLSATIARADGVVHATPIGMVHHPGVAFDVDLLRPDAWVSDVVYRPLETELVRRAAERHHAVLDGSRMAVGQAHASLRIITRRQPDRERMERHFRELVRLEESAAALGEAPPRIGDPDRPSGSPRPSGR